MTTRTLTGPDSAAQHWSDDFDLPAGEVADIGRRVAERYFSRV